jgi:hypothetical protein
LLDLFGPLFAETCSCVYYKFPEAVVAFIKHVLLFRMDDNGDKAGLLSPVEFLGRYFKETKDRASLDSRTAPAHKDI